MRSASKIAIGVAVSLGLGLAVATAIAHPGDTMQHMRGAMHGPGGGMSRMFQGDQAAGADMGLVHQMVVNHEQIKRTVTNLPDGIKTVTESPDPQVAQAIKAHVASMVQRLADGREFNLFSSTIPVLFENRDTIKTGILTTDTGAIVTQTSSDPKVVAALQAHALEVSELAREGMVAMRRNAGASMTGMMRRGPRAGGER